MFISNFYGFLLDEFGMLSRRAGFSATAELSCFLLLPIGPYNLVVLHCVSEKKGPTLKRYSSKLYGSILMIFGRNIQVSKLGPF